jgi:ABC-type transport system involved in multi-copper enzyme maturation permease subunit
MLRKKDVYVLLVLLAVVLMALLSVDVFGLGGIAGYVKDLGLLFTWLFGWILSVTISARELPTEEKQGTVYSLLAKPVARLELVLGKWLGAWSIACAATFCFYALIAGVVGLRGEHFAGGVLLQGYLLHAVALGMVAAISLALSTRMNADAAMTFAFALTGAAFVVVPRVPDLLVRVEGMRATALLGLYAFLPHFELFDMRQRLVYENSAAPWGPVCLVLCYGLYMTVVFLLLAWLGYVRKKFSRGAMS